jgi:hypothetical protein
VGELSVEPFSDLCIDGLIAYFKTVTDLHLYFSQNPRFVSDIRIWYSELDYMVRVRERAYIKGCFVEQLTTIPGGYDYIFTVDLAHIDSVPLTDEDVLVKRTRDNVTKKSATDSPLNLRLTSNDYLNTFVQLYRLFAKLEPQCLSPKKAELWSR